MFPATNRSSSGTGKL